MLRAYGPGCGGKLVYAARAKIPESATWIDLEELTEEEQLVERCLGLAVPTPDELAEIEPSSRLYERGGALYMTLNVLHGVVDGRPSSSPIGFVLSQDRLVTVRYVTPKPVRAFTHHVQREPDLADDALSALCGLLDAIVDRLADELEDVGDEIEKISNHIFSVGLNARRIPATRLTALLTRIGKTHLLLAKIRETAMSTSRFLSFLGGSRGFGRARAATQGSMWRASLPTRRHSAITASFWRTISISCSTQRSDSSASNRILRCGSFPGQP